MSLKFFVTDNLYLNAEVVYEDTFVIHLSNGKNILVKEDETKVFPWEINGQKFSDEIYARNYLERVIAEKLTGKRIILHAKREVPEICGVNGAACRCPGKCNTALCQGCPFAEEFFAKRDGVELIYAVGGGV